jgi:hypothetical protein
MSANETKADIGKPVTAGRPDVGEDEGKLGGRRASSPKRKAIKKTPDNFTYLNPADFPELFAADLPLVLAVCSELLSVRQIP